MFQTPNWETDAAGETVYSQLFDNKFKKKKFVNVKTSTKDFQKNDGESRQSLMPKHKKKKQKLFSVPKSYEKGQEKTTEIKNHNDSELFSKKRKYNFLNKRKQNIANNFEHSKFKDKRKRSFSSAFGNDSSENLDRKKAKQITNKDESLMSNNDVIKNNKKFKRKKQKQINLKNVNNSSLIQNLKSEIKKKQPFSTLSGNDVTRSKFKKKKQKHMLESSQAFLLSETTVKPTTSTVIERKKKKKRKKKQKNHNNPETINFSEEVSNVDNYKKSHFDIDKLKEIFAEKKGTKKKKSNNPESIHLSEKEVPDVHNQHNSAFKIEKLKKILASSTTHVKQIKSNEKIKETLTLREKMMQILQASRFRYINEQLYTSEGKDAKKYFQEEPEAFRAYHEGYQQQVKQWPVNPLDIIIKSLSKQPPNRIIADFGCGDARLARSLPNKVHSFDLVALSEEVTVCNMSSTPLSNASTDIVVFCLSLMGTNLSAYLCEANRILREGGLMKIAEVESRFEDIESFIKQLQRFGFSCTWKDLSYNLFYFMDFKKEKDISKKMKTKLREITLKPCLYKKR